MRAQGVRLIEAHCYICHHSAVLNLDQWPDAVRVPSFGLLMVCTGCGSIGADARPNWAERAPQPSFDGEPMHARVSFASIAAAHTVPERVLLLCVASGTLRGDTTWPRRELFRNHLPPHSLKTLR
jgi:hypothetical protein